MGIHQETLTACRVDCEKLKKTWRAVVEKWKRKTKSDNTDELIGMLMAFTGRHEICGEADGELRQELLDITKEVLEIEGS